MEEALVQWGKLFDDSAFDIWDKSPPKLALIQVMFHNLMKQLEMLQNTFNENYNENITPPASSANEMQQSNSTPVKNTQNAKRIPEDIQNTEAQLKRNVEISDVYSPHIFTDISVISDPDTNISDSIFNRNLFEIESPVPQQGVLSELISPTINRKKLNRKQKVPYPELNTSEKSKLQERMSVTSSQDSLIDFAKKIEPPRNVHPGMSTHDKTLQNITNNSPDHSNISQNDKTFHTPNLSKIRKRLHDLSSFTSNTSNQQPDFTNKVQSKSINDATINSENANKSSDATILLSCPVAANATSTSIDDSFLELPNIRTTKPMFLSKWEQKKLQQEDLDEQNCSRCGNFRGFQDLSPTMCGTKDYKCRKHRKKYMRMNTPEAIWNLGFPDSQ